MESTGDRACGQPMVTTTAGSELQMAIVRAMASIENRQPHDLRPLGEIVDPDALRAIVKRGDPATSVAFSYCGHRVVVTGTEIEIY